MSLCCSSVPGISNLEKSGPAQHIAVLLQHNVPTDSRCYRIHIYLLPFVYLLFGPALGLHCSMWVSSSRGARLLIAVAPLVAEHGL